jgi:beta-lactamase superfamily II metal-dependent hydrolase
MRLPKVVSVLVLLTGLGAGSSSSEPTKTLQIFAIDVEGGQATLIVTPSGHAMLIDTGWSGRDGRDADRIVTAAKLAGINKLDYVVITHYHRDHVGGVPQLAARIPIDTFVDHGPNLQEGDDPREDYATYLKVAAKAHRLIVKAGDTIPLKGATVEVLSAAGELITYPLAGAGKINPYCGQDPEAPLDVGENARSLGLLITFEKFRLIDMGDLTRKKELEMFCPKNLVGTVDVFMVSHHGYSESNSKAMVRALHARVAIMNNGPRKGGNRVAWQIVRESPGLEDLWQLHYAVESDHDHNVAEALIANPEENPDGGHYIRVAARADGSFRVTNSRNGEERAYSNGASGERAN